MLTAGLFHCPACRSIREFLEQPVEPHPVAFVTHDPVQLGTHQLRCRLLEFPRPLRGRDDTRLIKDTFDRRVEPSRPLPRPHQRPQRRESRRSASAGRLPMPRSAAPGRPEARFLVLDLVLRPRDTGDMRTMVEGHGRHGGLTSARPARAAPPRCQQRAVPRRRDRDELRLSGLLHGSGEQATAGAATLRALLRGHRFQLIPHHATCCRESLKDFPRRLQARLPPPAWPAARRRSGRRRRS